MATQPKEPKAPNKSSSLNREMAATVLMEAAYTTDEMACAKWGVHVRTLQRWRKLSTEDDVLAQLIREKQAAFNKTWAQEFPVTLHKVAQTLGKCVDEIAKDARAMKNPQIIEALNGSAKLVGDFYLTNKYIDARITRQDRAENELSGQGSADPAEDRVH